MYIVQIADLHLGSQNSSSRPEEELVKESIQKIKSVIPEGESILLCVCGDVIDSKDLNPDDTNEVQHRFGIANQIFQLFKDGLDKYLLVIKFCVGNHDVTHMDQFHQFACDFDIGLTKEGLEKGFIYDDQQGACLIFVNSCSGNQYEKGVIDYSYLKNLLSDLPPDSPKLLVLHHTIMSMDDKDSSSIRNAAELLGIIDSNNIVGILHGHNHGRDTLTIGRNHCNVIGTGALFSRQNADVNSQFNILHYKNGIFCSVINYRYNADSDPRERWSTSSLGQIDCRNYFEGSSFQKVHRDLLSKLAVRSPLYSVVLHIKCGYDTFDKEMAELFESYCLKIGEKEYKYPQLAELWEDVDVPPQLYFNHGSCFKVDGKHGIELIAEQLKNRPTSSRAVLPTYNADAVKDVSDGQGYLPSLTSIQFSQDNDGQDIYVHMNLRALDAGRFLNINICEIHWFLKELKSKGVQFKNVNIVISAFRVQVKRNFNCFLKAEIDCMAPTKLTVDISKGKYQKIRKLLEDKRAATETITNARGIKTLYEAMQDTNQACIEDKEEPMYPEALLNKVKDVLQIFQKLEELHLQCSIQSQKETEYDKKIEEKLGEIIADFVRLEGKE